MQQAEAIAAPRAKWLVAGAAAVLLGLVVRSAWVTEDAYITLRTVDNLVNGFGLRWNVAERVQGYTHPLWMIALSVLYFFTREDFFTTIALSLLTSAAAVVLLTKLARSGEHAFAALVLLCFSRSFLDFSTSGLENPLSHVLIAAFVWCYAVRGRGLRELAAIAALTALNRMDALLLVAPGLVHAGLHSLRTRGLKATAVDSLIGLSPLLAWEAFSLYYYGFLVPNTAYAKLNTGLPKAELARQGFTYLLNTFAWDTAGMIALLLGLGLSFWGRRLRVALLGLGIFLYLVYVVRVGGDFMIGRFITMPLFAAACVVAISRLPLEQPVALGAVLTPFALLFFQPNAVERFRAGDLTHAGIADERAFFRDSASLLMYTRTETMPNHGWADDGRALKKSKAKVVANGNVGFRGLFAGPSVYIIDWHALTDPLLSRLPVRHDPNWRVGHYAREVPKGYAETVEKGKCVMEDKNLCAYYLKMHEVVSGDLWSWSRIKTLIELNLGYYDHLIDVERYRYPGLFRESIAALTVALPEDAKWDSPGAKTFPQDGIDIALDALTHAKTVALMLDGNDDYAVQFRRGTELLGTVRLFSYGLGNLHTHRMNTPVDAVREGFDHLTIRATRGDGFYSVAHIRLR
jgi:arabinofuranosyltransferase